MPQKTKKKKELGSKFPFINSTSLFHDQNHEAKCEHNHHVSVINMLPRLSTTENLPALLACAPFELRVVNLGSGVRFFREDAKIAPFSRPLYRKVRLIAGYAWAV